VVASVENNCVEAGGHNSATGDPATAHVLARSFVQDDNTKGEA